MIASIIFGLLFTILGVLIVLALIIALIVGAAHLLLPQTTKEFMLRLDLDLAQKFRGYN